MKIDDDNTIFSDALALVEDTNHSVYLTGRAGTGKTTFLKQIKAKSKKNIAVVAPTGIAALNAGGTTIHSFFHLPFGPLLPDDPRLSFRPGPKGGKAKIFDTVKLREEQQEIIQKLELLIIDEISMVRCDVLDSIDKVLRAVRGKIEQPFGGVQLLLIGDLFQLPPVTRREEWSLLSRSYESEFFFSAKVLKENPPAFIELKKIYRQKDSKFIELLEKIRLNNVTIADIDFLNARKASSAATIGAKRIILGTKNKMVENTNAERIQALDAKAYRYEAEIDGVFPDKILPTHSVLELKIGAQVMFIKNDSERKQYFNGMLATVTELYEDEIVVTNDSGEEIEVDRREWENIEYSLPKGSKSIKEKVLGTFNQFPLKLAWAITVHKSQGLTFENVEADLSDAFAAGQVYVALSRCTSLEGLVMRSPISRSAIKTDRRVLDYTRMRQFK